MSGVRPVDGLPAGPAPASRRARLGGLGAASAGLLAALVIAVAAPATSAPVLLLATAVGGLALIGLAVEWAQLRYFSPEALVYLFSLLTFSIRPAFLAANVDVLGSWDPARTTAQYLSDLRSQEIVQFITTRFPGDVPDLLFTTTLIGSVFLGGFVTGRLLGGRGADVVRTRSGTAAKPSPALINALVGGLLLIGLAGQVMVISSVGGIGNALANLETQKTLEQGFVFFILANFVVAGLLVWAGWGRLRGPALALFMAVLLETVVFAALTGSRTRTFLPILAVGVVIHLCRRPWRRREVVAAILAVIVVGTSLLVVRQLSERRPLAEAVTSGVTSGLSLDVLTNDNSSFDTVVQLAAVTPDALPHQNGRRLLAGATSFLPSQVYPGKPEAGDVWFRRFVWGGSVEAGRPYTLPGELWLDFSWLGLGAGAIGLGLAAGWYRRRAPRPGTATPAAAIVGAVVSVTVWELLNGVYANGSAILLQFGVPLLLAGLVIRVAARPERRERQSAVH